MDSPSKKGKEKDKEKKKKSKEGKESSSTEASPSKSRKKSAEKSRKSESSSSRLQEGSDASGSETIKKERKSSKSKTASSKEGGSSADESPSTKKDRSSKEKKEKKDGKKKEDPRSASTSPTSSKPRKGDASPKPSKVTFDEDKHNRRESLPLPQETPSRDLGNSLGRSTGSFNGSTGFYPLPPKSPSLSYPHSPGFGNNGTAERLTGVFGYSAMGTSALAPQCESCEMEKGTVYCANCDMILCTNCNSNGHMIPAFYTHQRVSYSPAVVVRNYCSSHRKEVTRYYCDTCDVLICNQCRLTGEHQGSAHLTMDLMEAYRIKHSTLRAYVSDKLDPKKEKMSVNVSKMETLISDIKKRKAKVQSTLVSEIEGIIDHVQSMEMRYTSNIVKESEALKSELQQIQTFINDVMTIPPTSLFSNYDQLTSICDQLARKAVRPVPDVNAEDYEHQFRKGYVSPELFDTQERDKKELEDKYHETEGMYQTYTEMTQNTMLDIQVEMEEWIGLCNEYKHELKRYAMRCYFCAKWLAPEILNSDCHRNITPIFTRKSQELRSSSKAAPPSYMFGSSRHFWVSED